MQFQAMAFGLRSARLRTYVEKISAEAEAFFRTRWSENSGTRDLLADLSELTIMTASRCLHGDDVRENMYEQVADLYFDLDHGVTPLSVFWCNAPTEAHKKRDIARKRMVELFGKVIKQRRMETPEEAKAKNRTDILDVFMNAKYKDGSMMSDSEVTGLLIALLFAGQHTSSISSTWTAMFIAHHSSITDRVNAEQTKVMKDGR
jgi:sterol 14-demethylase